MKMPVGIQWVYKLAMWTFNISISPEYFDPVHGSYWLLITSEDGKKCMSTCTWYLWQLISFQESKIEAYISLPSKISSSLTNTCTVLSNVQEYESFKTMKDTVVSLRWKYAFYLLFYLLTKDKKFLSTSSSSSINLYISFLHANTFLEFKFILSLNGRKLQPEEEKKSVCANYYLHLPSLAITCKRIGIKFLRRV